MAIALAQVEFPNVSGFPVDKAVHTFHFAINGALVGSAAADAIAAQLRDFYNVTHAPGTSPLGNEMSNVIARSLCVIKVYDITGPAPHPPMLTFPFTLVATSSTGFPNEVALVLSYNGTLVPNVPVRRNRGRVYLGPLTTGNSVLSSGDVRPTTTAMNKLVGAGNWLRGTFGAPQVINWVVYSRTQRAQGGPQETWAIPVGRVHVDDAYDTQRRRGRVATTRVILP